VNEGVAETKQGTKVTNKGNREQEGKLLSMGQYEPTMHDTV